MKTALVTGANKGIGLEICRQLGELGFQVFLTARNPDKGLKAIQSLTSEQLPIDFIQMDVSDIKSIEKAYSAVKQQVDKLDVLINNAGILLDEGKSILDSTYIDAEDTMQINAMGVLHVCRTFLPLLKTDSRIINISSGVGAISEGISTWAPLYSISKATENIITRQLAHALNPKGILVNAVCPGWVRTDMGGSGATRSIQKGAETPVWLASATGFSTTGKFFRDKEIIPW